MNAWIIFMRWRLQAHFSQLPPPFAFLLGPAKKGTLSRLLHQV